MALVAVAEFADRIAADVARLRLEAAGIDAVLFDGGMASLGLGLMTPVRMMVDESDVTSARAITESV